MDAPTAAVAILSIVSSGATPAPARSATVLPRAQALAGQSTVPGPTASLSALPFIAPRAGAGAVATPTSAPAITSDFVSRPDGAAPPAPALLRPLFPQPARPAAVVPATGAPILAGGSAAHAFAAFAPLIGPPAALVYAPRPTAGPTAVLLQAAAASASMMPLVRPPLPARPVGAAISAIGAIASSAATSNASGSTGKHASGVPGGYRGVTHVASHDLKWKATINQGGRSLEIGNFATERLAAEVSRTH